MSYLIPSAKLAGVVALHLYIIPGNGAYTSTSPSAVAVAVSSEAAIPNTISVPIFGSPAASLTTTFPPSALNLTGSPAKICVEEDVL